MIFVSIPYNHPDPAVIDRRVEVLIDYTAKLLAQGHVVSSPVLVYHQVVKKYPHLFTDVEYFFWEQASCQQLKSCDVVHLLMMEGWDKSTGVKLELGWADKLCIPVKQIPMPLDLQVLGSAK